MAFHQFRIAALRPTTSRPLAVPCLLFALFSLLMPSLAWAALPVKPSRVLVLADARARDGRVFRDAGELGDALGLLSLWGIPHDVLRLDTQLLREESLLDSAGQPLYGVILWTVRTDLLPRKFQEGEVLRNACLKHHISLIAFGNRLDPPAVEELLGLRVLGWREFAPPLAAGEPSHFILRNELPLPSLADEQWCAAGPAVDPARPEVKVLIRLGGLPLVTACTLDAATATRAVWLGGDADYLLRGEGSGLGIRLFQRALVWSIGALVVHDYDNALLLRMDDPGASQDSYLRGWENPSPPESLMRQKVLAPLREHHARLDVFCCPGYVDAHARTILHAEQVSCTDAFGHRQDLRSLFASLLEGQKQGLVEISSHGWTHMAPDLDTPPPGGIAWWAGKPATEWADYTWYREFYDVRRDRDVPPEVQLQHLRTSCDWLEGFFGRRPLAFCPPGHAVSGDSWTYAKETLGSLEIHMEGLPPKAQYSLFVGEEPDWTFLGDLHADASGTIHTTLVPPADLWLDEVGWFTFNNPSGRTEFIAGPVCKAPGFAFSYPVQDKARMSSVERAIFPTASLPLRQGSITGRLDTRTWRPPTRSHTCTYVTAGQAGLGLVIDTLCHRLDGPNVTSLRMIPVVSNAEYLAPALFSHAGMPTVFRFHTRDLAENPDFLPDLLKSLSGQGRPVTSLTADELAGYLHACWTLRPGPDNSLAATADFTSPLCRYLGEHESNWTLLATDEVLSALRGNSRGLIVRQEGGTESSPYPPPGPSGQVPFRVPAGRDVHIVLSHDD